MAFEETIADYLDLLQSKIRRNMSELDVNATGDTSRSIKYSIFESSGQLTANENIKKTEAGGKPARQGGGISLSAAMAWIEVRQLSINAETLKRNIDTMGTRLFQDGGRTTIYTDTINDKRLENLFIETIADDTENEILWGFEL